MARLQVFAGQCDSVSRGVILMIEKKCFQSISVHLHGLQSVLDHIWLPLNDHETKL